MIPYADYVIPAEQLFFVSLYVALAIVVMATAGFFVFGIVVTRPITGIARSMEAITKELVFDDDRYTRGSSHLAEISSMLESFSRLRFGLQSFSRYVPLSVVRTLMQVIQYDCRVFVRICLIFSSSSFAVEFECGFGCRIVRGDTFFFGH